MGMYTIRTLRAIWNGMDKRTECLYVEARLVTGRAVGGYVTGMGSKLGLHLPNGELVEDVRPEQVTSVDVREAPAAKPKA